MRRLLRLAAAPAAILVVLLFGGLAPASAHPLGNFTVNRYSGLVVAPSHLRIDRVLDLAEVPTAQLGRRIERLGPLAASLCRAAARDLDVSVGGRQVPLDVTAATARTRAGAAGLPVLRVECALEGAFRRMAGRTDVRLRDTADRRIGWREVTARGSGVRLLTTDVPADSVSRRLTRYPADLLSSPLSVDTADLVVRPGATAPVVAADQPTGPATDGRVLGGVSALTTRVSRLLDEQGLWVAVLALLAATALGAGHALAPGHGKTVMAFYLVNRHSRSLRAAFGVGATVTLAHTASVLTLSALVLAGAALVPERVYPWLTVVSGGLILTLGAGLLRSARHGHHGHTHAHGDAVGPSPAARSRAQGRAGVLTLGLVGGLVPSPSALLLLLVAVHLGRPGLGGLMVIAFGTGMAVTLGVVGVLAAGLTQRLEVGLTRRSRASALARAGVTYGAAGGVCLVGVGVVVRALAGM